MVANSEFSQALKARNWYMVRSLLMLGHHIVVKNEVNGRKISMFEPIYIDKELLDFLESSPCIRDSKQLKTVLSDIYFDTQSSMISSYINKVEIKTLLLLALYSFTGFTCSGLLGLPTTGLFLGFSVLGTIACKHSRTLMEFGSNIAISIDDKIIKNALSIGSAINDIISNYCKRSNTAKVCVTNDVEAPQRG